MQSQQTQETTYQPKPGPLAVHSTAETAGMVLAAQAEALVKARYWIAIQKPRDLDAVPPDARRVRGGAEAEDQRAARGRLA